MICQHCTKQLQPDWKFCPKCGNAVDEQKEPARSYGSSVRAQVFEVIVRQGLAGAPWRYICAGPMKVNNISEEEIQAEIDRRRSL
jgi:hypothetical protein